MATATDYLPEAVGGYLRLPREWADTRPIDGYKTSLMVLVDQLELLGSTMDKILDSQSAAAAGQDGSSSSPRTNLTSGEQAPTARPRCCRSGRGDRGGAARRGRAAGLGAAEGVSDPSP